ncbi:MAG TPA: hypothetical protein DCM38_07245 [Gammaproteobacteria bacterium]|nr:hypothetical protein [Gammaproteobacteria bacterium]
MNVNAIMNTDTAAFEGNNEIRFNKGEHVIVIEQLPLGNFIIASLDGKKTGWVADFEIEVRKPLKR